MSDRDQSLIPCPICDGTGEITQFNGVSRFLLSNDPCPNCLGLGRVEDKGDQGGQTKTSTSSGDETP